MHFIVGLGNPGEEYDNTRHNIGREIVEAFANAQNIALIKDSKKNSIWGEGKAGKEKVAVILPEIFMNRSGLAVSKFVKSKKSAESLIVVHDDLDLPLGTIKIVFSRGSGGHKGVESIARTLKTKDFVRLKVGVSPKTPKGKLRKPSGEEKVVSFVLGKWKGDQEKEIKKVKKKALEALEAVISEGRTQAMNQFNR